MADEDLTPEERIETGHELYDTLHVLWLNGKRPRYLTRNNWVYTAVQEGSAIVFVRGTKQHTLKQLFNKRYGDGTPL